MQAAGEAASVTADFAVPPPEAAGPEPTLLHDEEEEVDFMAPAQEPVEETAAPSPETVQARVRANSAASDTSETGTLDKSVAAEAEAEGPVADQIAESDCDDASDQGAVHEELEVPASPAQPATPAPDAASTKARPAGKRRPPAPSSHTPTLKPHSRRGAQRSAARKPARVSPVKPRVAARHNRTAARKQQQPSKAEPRQASQAKASAKRGERRAAASKARTPSGSSTSRDTQRGVKAAPRISTTSRELAEIAKARKEIARRQAANARRAAALKSGTGGAPSAAAAQRKAPTRPVAPALSTSTRRAGSAVRRQQPAPGSKQVARAVKTASKAPTKLTQPVPFKFNYKYRDPPPAPEEAYVSLAESVSRFSSADNPRFHSKSKAALAKGPSPVKAPAVTHATTVAVPFHFKTDEVVHSHHVRSTAEAEEEYMARLQPFKARPAPQPGHGGPGAGHVAPPRPLTQPMSPALATDRRLGKKAPPAEPASPGPAVSPFKARPAPAFDRCTGVPPAAARPFVPTVPQSPMLATSARASAHAPPQGTQEPEYQPFKASSPHYNDQPAGPRHVAPPKAPTVAEPFHLQTDSRHAASAAALAARAAAEAESAAAARKFKARAVGEGVPKTTLRAGAPPRQATVPQPFALSAPPPRGAQGAVDDVAPPAFKARPVPASVKAPAAASSIRLPHRKVQANSPGLASNARAAKRAAYEAAKAKRAAQREAEAAAQAAAAAAAEEAELKRMRREEMTFKARPIRMHASAVGGGTLAPRRAPTVPRSPKLGPAARKGTTGASQGKPRSGPRRVKVQE